MMTRSVLSKLSVVVAVALSPSLAFAQSALSNGANHSSTLQVGGLDTWTFTATKNDGVTLSLGKVLGAGADPNFTPWLRVKGPDGSSVASRTGDFANSVEVDLRAPLSGTYSVLVSSSTSQTSAAGYVLTLVKTPGPYAISTNDEGGPMTNGTHTGTLTIGDLDAWTIQAAAGDSIVVSLGKIPTGGSDPFFTPWLRLKGPDGALLASQSGDFANSVQIDQRAPSTGTYTLIVASSTSQADSANYVLTLSGPSAGFSVSAILVVAGSTQGNGAFFRTRVQMYNPRNASISGRLVFHNASTSGSSNDRSLAYTIGAGQTIDYPDLLPAMGISSGLGSVDIITNPGDPLPVLSARIFSDAGVSGTAGFFIDPVGPDAALRAGETAVLIAPADSTAARLNLGIRSLDTGATFSVVVRNNSGIVRTTLTKTYAPTFFEQVSANSYLGVTLNGSDTITFTMTSGKAIIYGAQTDNKTQDPSVQYARTVF